MNIFHSLKFVHLPPNGLAATTWELSAGVTEVNSGSIDRKGFEEVGFLCEFGDNADTATFVAKVQHSDDDVTFTDALDKDGNTITVSFTAAASDTDNKAIGKGLVGTKMKRYVRLAFTRDVANTVINSLWGILANPQSAPTTQPTGAGQFIAAPTTSHICS